MNDEKPMGQVIQIDEARIRDHLGEMVRGTVEETLNAMPRGSGYAWSPRTSQDRQAVGSRQRHDSTDRGRQLGG
jgi:hypothetical protein